MKRYAEMLRLFAAVITGTILFAPSLSSAYTCNLRENVYTGGCSGCPLNDTESNSFKKISFDCLQCTNRCDNVTPVVDKSSDTSSCGHLPWGLTELKLLTLSTSELEELAKANPYVAMAVFYGQLGEVGERSPFDSKSIFSASLTTEQAIRGMADMSTLESGRSPFDSGYRVVVESSFDELDDGKVVRRFLTRYHFPQGDAIAIDRPILLELSRAGESTDSAHPGVTLVNYRLKSVGWESQSATPK